MFEKILKAFLLLVAVYAVYVLLRYAFAKVETFTFQGTMTQLDSSHVPTEEDVEEAEEERQQVRHDLVDMTGSA
jgi:cell division protein FtsL